MILFCGEMMDYIEYKKIIKECYAISKRKNRLYGDLGLIKFGKIGIFTRIYDKICRIDYLLKKEPKTDESLEDSIKDSINYMIYLLIYLRKKK